MWSQKVMLKGGKTLKSPITNKTKKTGGKKMKFTQKPKQVFIVEEEDEYYLLRDAKPWKNLWIMQELNEDGEEKYCIMDKEMESEYDFYYDKTKIVGKYLLAYFEPEKFHIYDEDGNLQMWESPIVGLSYEEVEDNMLVYATNSYFWFQDGVFTEALKTAYLLSTSKKTAEGEKQYVGVIKLSYDSILTIEIGKEQTIEKEASQVYLHFWRQYHTAGGERIKMLVSTEEKTYGASFLQDEKAPIFVELEDIFDVCEASDRYVMYESGEGRKILHNIADNTTFETEEYADGADFKKAEIWFWKLVNSSRFYTQIYDKETNELLLKCYSSTLKEVQMDNTAYHCWQEMDEESFYLYTVNTKALFEKVKWIKAKDGYVLLCIVKNKGYMYFLYKITRGIGCIAIWQDKQEQVEYPIIFVGTTDIVVISKFAEDLIFYKGILIKKESNQRERHLRCGYTAQECREKWKNIIVDGGFITIPGIGKYYVDIIKKKAYSKWSSKYWWKKFFG